MHTNAAFKLSALDRPAAGCRLLNSEYSVNSLYAIWPPNSDSSDSR
jgi:hypothetical protein